jgi:ubiquitin C-terminal hydrolase
MNGFVNLGNTCYLNATLQLIFSIKELKEYFISKIFLKEMNGNLKNSDLKDNNIKKNIIFIQNFFSLINDYSNNNNKILIPKNLLNSIQSIYTDFNGYEQHDSQEILLIILDLIHENLKYDIEVNYKGTPKNDTDILVIDSVNALSKILNYKYSISNELFYGMYYNQYKSIETDSNNKLVSKNYEHFNNLTLEFDGNNLIENLDIFFKNEILDSKLYDEKTKKKYKVTKEIKIVNSPKYLFITLKKYNTSRKKHNNEYTFPIYNLDFSKYCLGYDKYQCTYDLLGATCHEGGLSYGHYYSIINNNNSWFLLNDDKIMNFNMEKNKNTLFNNAYVLLYVKNKNENI